MAKLHLSGNKLSSDELNRMLCTDTTEAVSMDTGVEHEDVSATNILSETNRSDTTTDISATNNPSDESVSATNNSRGQYINQYKKDHYDVLRISLPKGVKAVLQQEAKERNVSVTNMILQALTQYLGVDVSSTNGE